MKYFDNQMQLASPPGKLRWLTYFISDILRLGEHLALSGHGDGGLLVTVGGEAQI